MTVSKRYAAFIGRWQPFHEGHEWLVAQKLDQGVPVLIMVRDCERDAQNPFTATEVCDMIQHRYADDDVRVIIIPDIESINYGRHVGYEVNEWVPPQDVANISATKIRANMEGK